MLWVQSLDLSLLRLVRETLRNPFFDWLMPLLSGNILFAPALALVAIAMWWKGGARARVCLIMLAVIVFVGDSVVCSTLKQTFGRSRPAGFDVLVELQVPVGKPSSYSMPSSHATNWFAAATIAFLYYRRSLYFMLPLALAVSYSRIYKGAHYPTDVVAGAVLGTGFAFGAIWLVDRLWCFAGERWFPLWWARLPSLVRLNSRKADLTENLSNAKTESRQISITSDQQWLRLGYVLIGLLFLVRLVYLASGRIELGIDEAYQWVWSKRLALSYYSKPPLIAYTQRLGTALWGDTAFGVRFFSPVCAAICSCLLLRFLTRQGNVRAGFWLVVISAATPLLAVGATVLTVDCLLVLFWTAAMITGWEAVQKNSLAHWLWAGLWMGLGALSKYTALLQPLCWIIFFLLCKPARVHLRRPGPYLALLIAGTCTLPVWIWNMQHGWITLTHVAANARIDRPWKPSLFYFWDFLSSELALLNPVFFVAALWAAIAVLPVLRRQSPAQLPAVPATATFGAGRELSGPSYAPFAEAVRLDRLDQGAVTNRLAPDRALLVFLLSMGAPLFLGYWLFTFHSRVLPNWIAASVLPLFCLMAWYWDGRYRAGLRAVKKWLTAGVSLGLSAVVLLHDTNLVTKIIRKPLPTQMDPLRQVRAWPETAETVAEARAKLLAEDGRPAFIICGHYGMTGELSFYLPEAKAGLPDHPLVYYQSSEAPMNQFFFWPGYQDRKGENAIYVSETDQPHPPPERLCREFERIKDLGMKEILYRGRVFRRLQLFECRDLR